MTIAYLVLLTDTPSQASHYSLTISTCLGGRADCVAGGDGVGKVRPAAGEATHEINGRGKYSQALANRKETASGI